MMMAAPKEESYTIKYSMVPCTELRTVPENLIRTWTEEGPAVQYAAGIFAGLVRSAGFEENRYAMVVVESSCRGYIAMMLCQEEPTGGFAPPAVAGGSA